MKGSNLSDALITVQQHMHRTLIWLGCYSLQLNICISIELFSLRAGGSTEGGGAVARDSLTVYIVSDIQTNY
jgi:hypothetical protein